jgi:hypothetical protein
MDFIVKNYTFSGKKCLIFVDGPLT